MLPVWVATIPKDDYNDTDCISIYATLMGKYKRVVSSPIHKSISIYVILANSYIGRELAYQ